MLVEFVFRTIQSGAGQPSKDSFCHRTATGISSADKKDSQVVLQPWVCGQSDDSANKPRSLSSHKGA
ncbi:MAG: hypothetical protein Fues2KO_32780 [Fuerstiella sp.]